MQKIHPTPEEDFLPSEPPALRSTSLTRSHSFARTHDTNAKRNQNRFPDWGQLTLSFPPISDIYIYIYIYIEREREREMRLYKA